MSRKRPPKNSEQSRAESFWQAEELRRTRYGSVQSLDAPFPASKLMTPEAECHADKAIREAIETGFLAGQLIEIRADLALTCAMAWGSAAAIYAEQLTAPVIRERKLKAQRIAEALRDFLPQIENEAQEAAEIADKMEIEYEADDLWSIMRHARAMLPHLVRYAEPEPSSANSANATDHLSRQFFGALGEWWIENAADPDRRGASATRNRLALGLWLDMEQIIPDGYSDYDFARRGFRLGKIDR